MRQDYRLTATGVMILIVTMALAGCRAAQVPDTAPTTPGDSSLPAGGALADIVAASAVVVPYREAALGIKAGGRVMELYVTAGDTVAEGQPLARVDTRDLEQQVRQTEAALRSVEAGLAKVKAGARPEEIAIAQTAVAIADAGVKSAEEAVTVTESTLAAARADAQAVASAVDIARGSLAAAQAVQNSAQAALNKLLAGPTQVQIRIAEKELERAQNELYALQTQRDVTRNVAEGQLSAAQAVVDIARLQLDELRAGSRAEDVAGARAQLAQAVAGVQVANGQLAQAEARVIQAAANVRIAEAQVAQVKAQLEGSRAQADQARAQLDQTRAGARPEDIAAAEAAVAQAEATLGAARNALEDATLRAPFAGVIGAVLIEAGELAAPSAPIMRLGDLTRLRVRTDDLGEIDIGLVRLGQEVVVTVDAMTGTRINGTVVRIAPAAEDRRGDKVYPVLIDIDPAAGANLRWGMSAFVEIQVR